MLKHTTHTTLGVTHTHTTLLALSLSSNVQTMGAWLAHARRTVAVEYFLRQGLGQHVGELLVSWRLNQGEVSQAQLLLDPQVANHQVLGGVGRRRVAGDRYHCSVVLSYLNRGGNAAIATSY